MRQTLRAFRMYQSSEIGTAVTVGTFDGVHRGHRKVVEFLKAKAEDKGLQPVVITFDPHPLAVVAPERAPRLLDTAVERVSLLGNLGVEVRLLAFDEPLRRLTAREWLRLLKERFNAKLLVIGYDNKFGCDGRNYDFETYRKSAAEEGIEIMEAPVVNGVCSSLIRNAIASGDLAGASDMLGRNYSLSGIVGHGRGDGHRIGFPTANLMVAAGLQLPSAGVYAANAFTKDGSRYRSVVNIGVAPTIGDGLPLTIEAHLLDFSGDIYSQPLRIEFLDRLRDERRFSSLEDLKQGIYADISAARNLTLK